MKKHAFGTSAVAALLLPAMSIVAQTSGTWMYTGRLNQARFNHSSVLLNNGKVLVFGGQYQLRHAKAILLSELYDPVTGVWTPSGNSNAALEYGTATLLPSGKVLATRGCSDFNCNTPAGSAELYDPSSGTWSVTGAMVSPRSYQTATLLTNGKVLVAGGCYSACGIYNMNNAELYDPGTGLWTATGSMSARAQHTATLLPNGKVLVAGGISGADIVASAEIYDPATEKWSPVASMASARRFAQATLLNNGRVLVMGGQNYSVTLAAAETYDPLANKWSAAGKMSSPRLYFAVAALPQGKVLAVGGADPSHILAGADIYDPATGRWSKTGSMNLGRIYFTATPLPDGRVLAAAGNVGDNTAELYRP